MPERKRYTIAVDFDGVIHSYVTPWIAAFVIPDAPVPGAMLWLYTMIQKFEVNIFTTRGKSWRGRRTVREWLKRYAGGMWNGHDDARGLKNVRITATKEPALIYLDDRAVRFDGKNFPSVEEVHKLRPWSVVRRV